MKKKIEYTSADAVISDCGKFRYALRRFWRDDRAALAFIMLNPSTADADQDDATIRKCVGFADRLGFGGIVVGNLFAYRATDPKDLKANGFPCGPKNDFFLQGIAEGSPVVVAAWGANANRTPRPAQVCKMLQAQGAQLTCLGVTQDGFPLHPLMLSYDRKLEPYSF